MPNLLSRIARRSATTTPAYWAPPEIPTWELSNPQPYIEGRSYQAMVDHVLSDYSPIGAALFARQLLAGQWYPRWRDDTSGNTFGDKTLAPLERPQFYGRSYFYRRIELDASLHGTAYIRSVDHEDGPGLRILPPEKTRIIIDPGVDDDQLARLQEFGQVYPSDIPDARVAGYAYDPTGQFRYPETLTYYDRGDVVHYAPEPHENNLFAGKSWIVSCLAEILADKQVRKHTDGYLERGAVPGLAIIWPKEDANSKPMQADELQGYRDVISKYHSGASGRGRALVLAGGPQVMPVGAHLNQMELRDLTAGYESRIASRARIPQSVLGLREALQGSSLNAGNYGAARRLWADLWGSPTFDDFAEQIEPILDSRPPAASLHWDRSRVLFFQEDAADAAEIASKNAAAVTMLVRDGFEPDAAVEMVSTGKVGALAGNHSGLPSVQLQETEETAPPADTSTDEEETDDDE